jgi:hypothetical protein
MRFESLYDEVLGGPSDQEWDRTNYGGYKLNTRDLITRPAWGRLKSEAEWLRAYPHQRTLAFSQQEVEADEAARESRIKEIEAEVDKARVAKQTNSEFRLR